jgi:hypothetical protein
MFLGLVGVRRLAVSIALAVAANSPAAAVAAAEPSSPTLSHNTYLKASNTDPSDGFGTSVAIDGDTMVVGAVSEDSNAVGVNGNQADDSAYGSGAAYVFVRVGGGWSQQAYLKASNPDNYDDFGRSVAIDGNTVVIGAPFEDSAATGVGGDQASDDAVNSGAAYVFTRTGSAWTQQAYLKASNTGQDDHFGESVSVSADTVVVAASMEASDATTINGNQASNAAGGAGAAYVFTRTGVSWSQQAYLKASNAQSGDAFGYDVAISGDTVLVGAPGEDSDSTGVNGNSANDAAQTAGAAYVFARSSGTWTQQAYLKAINTDASDTFGTSVAIDTDTAVVGAPGEDSGATGVNGNGTGNTVGDAGAAYVYTRSGGNWAYQAYLKASNTGEDLFGWPVEISGDTIVVGASYESSDATGVNSHDNDAATASGAAYAFVREPGVWNARGYLKATNTETVDFFASSVGVSNDVIVVGAPAEDSGSVGVDGDAADDSASDSGAVYVLGPPCSAPPFSDVPSEHAFCPEIEWMSQTGVSTGFGNGTFKPSIAVTRQAMAAFLARFADATYPGCGEFGPFEDVPTSHPFCAQIQWMQSAGISNGFDDGTYRPSIPVTRQSMAAFLARIAGASLPACSIAPFSDVSTSHPFCKEIAWMKSTGISTGFGDGTYRPATEVTRQAMSAFLYRLRLVTSN